MNSLTLSVETKVGDSPGTLGMSSSPKKRRVPPAHKFEGEHALGFSARHRPEKDFVEPKVLSPHKTRPGQIPREIQVERKKRAFMLVNVTQILNQNGVIAHLIATYNNTSTDSMESMPLSMFYNSDFDSRPIGMWAEMANQSYLKARALHTRMAKGQVQFEWKRCTVVGASDDVFEVVFGDPHAVHEGKDPSRNIISELGSTSEAVAEGEGATVPATATSQLHRLFICFDAEDPDAYCNHLLEAMKRKHLSIASVALNLYVDCMPLDGIKEIESEQITRIVANAVNMDSLRQNALLDTTAVVQQFNMNHMRTLNQLILANLLRTHQSEMSYVKMVGMDPSVFSDPSQSFAPLREVAVDAEVLFSERVNAFKFCSLWNKIEPVRIMLQLSSETIAIDKLLFFTHPEKTLRLDEFNMNQQYAASAMTAAVKDHWANSIALSVRNNLKDVKKGWFNLDESNLEVYKFSKIRNFMVRINFVMEDALRDLIQRSTSHYVTMIGEFCPTAVTVRSNAVCDVEGGKFPLFTADLKFIESTPEAPAKIVYSAQPDTLFETVVGCFDHCFEMLKGIVKIERRAMKNLFWAYDPVMMTCGANEPWAIAQRERLSTNLKRALQPMHDYLETLHEFMELISIDIKEYAAEAEAKWGNAEGTMNLPELCNLAKKHAVDSEAIFYALPSNVNLGLVMVDCRSIKKMLAMKHKNIAAKLFDVLEKKAKEYADTVVEDFREMYDKLTRSPTDIEGVAEMKDFMSTLQVRIDQLSDRIGKNDSHYALMEQAKWQIPMDQMDVRWEVFRWPGKMATEMLKQEKNLRQIEVQFKKQMEEEQEDFNQDVNNLKADVDRLRNLTELKGAVKNAETVRRLKASLNGADERSRLFNSRETLFGVADTSYDELGDLAKLFDPFYDLWDSAEKWLSNKETWTFGAFNNLDAENVENAVSVLLRNLAKSAKTFERMNLSSVNVIAAQVRDEVDIFRPKVPLIVALRNPGMRDRHWEELQAKTGAEIPSDRSVLTLQMLCDLGLNHDKAMADVEKVAEKASKEFGIEQALNKMSAAWVPVSLIVENYKDTGTCILKGIDEYMALLDEHITMTQAMAFSAFKVRGGWAERDRVYCIFVCFLFCFDNLGNILFDYFI